MTLTTLPLVTTTEQYYSATVTEPKVISTTFESSEETTTSMTLTTLHTSPEIEQDCSQAIRLREMIAWALVFLLTLLLIGTLLTVICMYKRSSMTRDNVTQAPAYEMDGNPCYENIKVKEANSMETNIYEAV